MREFLLAICAPAIWVIAAIELALMILMIPKIKKTGSKVIICTALITFGLFFDAFIIALGTIFSAESMAVVSRFRFITHGVLIPLLFPICAEALNLKRVPKIVVYVITGLLMVAGLAEALATVLGPVEIAGISRMASVKGETPAWAEGISRVLSFGTVIPLMIVGVIAWIKEKTPFLFLAGFLMFAFSAVGPATGNSDLIFFISMFGEVLMVVFLLLYGLKRTRAEKNK